MEIKDQENEFDDSALSKKIQNSNAAISDLINDCTDMVLNVQVANDMKEIKRREEEQRLRKSRTAFLEEEATKAEAQFNDISSKWEPISKLKDTIDICNALEDQKNKYMELIQQKNNIIDALKKELAHADERFMEDQELQKEDIEILSDRINEHITIMKNAYRRHLELIEDTAKRQSQVRLHEKHEEWLRINNAFKQEGVEELNETFNCVEEYEKLMMQMIWDHYEEYRTMKKTMETELQNLQIVLEETKATCLINEKKLEYNYLVLSKRQEELGQVKARQRRQINNLLDELNNLERKKLESEQEHQSKCKKLKEEISKLESVSSELSKKKERLDDVNETTFKRVWKMNEKRVRKLIDKMLETDKRIHEQILHVEWTPPNLSFLKISELPSVQFALRHVAQYQKSGLGDDGEKVTEISLKDYSPLSPDLDTIKFILQNIAENIKFIISDKISVLTKNLPVTKQSLVCFDNVLKVLQIKNESELQLLKQHFLPAIRGSICSTKTQPSSRKLTFPSIASSKSRRAVTGYKRTGSGSKIRKSTAVIDWKRPASTPGRRRVDSSSSTSSPRTICDDREHSCLDPSTVIKILTEYMKDKKQREKQATISKIQKIPLSRILTTKDIELYWNAFHFKSLEDITRLWDVMLPSVNSHRKLLKDQKVLREEIRNIEKQNSELRRALKYFMEKSADCHLREKQLQET